MVRDLPADQRRPAEATFRAEAGQAEEVPVEASFRLPVPAEPVAGEERLRAAILRHCGK